LSGNYLYNRHGINSRLDEIQAAVLRLKLRHIDTWIKLRTNKAELYDIMLGDMPIARTNRGHAFLQYP
jgi:dTDP-4-amino-4,6-dideoxygalactose transaminase